MSELRDAETAGRSAFLSAVKRACKKGGHTFESGFSSHTLNGGNVDMGVTAIKKPHTSRDWSGKLQVTVSAGGYPVLMSKAWRVSGGEWPLDEILAHALKCAAHNKQKEDRYDANRKGREATLADKRLPGLKASAGRHGGHLEVTDSGRLRVTFDHLDFESAAALLNATSALVQFQTAADRASGSDFED